MKQNTRKGIALAILAAALYAVSSPVSKLLLTEIPPVLTAGFLYLGAGAGMLFIAMTRKIRKTENAEYRLTKADLPYTAAMIILDIAAPVSLMIGLESATAANASLLNNFEIVATAIIALLVFHEKISARLWMGIVFITLSCALLTFENTAAFRFSSGSLLILLAASFWGLENNCTRKLSSKDPLEIVLLKGFFSGGGSILIGFADGERISSFGTVPAALLTGFIAYGLSIYFYVYAQRLLGAARTSAYYAVSPFIAAVLSLLLFRETPGPAYAAALIFMIIGAWLSAQDRPLFKKAEH